jgi:M6 family metalloprotease-like protein
MKRAPILAFLTVLVCLLVAQGTLPGTAAGETAAFHLPENNQVAPHLVASFNQRLLALGVGVENPLQMPVRVSEGLAPIGTARVLVLPIRFTDKSAKLTRVELNDRMFGDGDATYFPYESLADFYRRSSRGKLTVTGRVLPWYKAPYPRSHVEQTDAGRERLIEEALRHWDEAGNDFSSYDTNADGTIDYLIVVWAGESGKWGTFWWAYYPTSWNDQAFAVDGKHIGAYSWQWDFSSIASHRTPRVTIHEMGHALGLPDYYDYEDTKDIGPAGGVGGIDMMDSNIGDHNCFSKFLLGWITPTVVPWGQRQDVILRPAATSGDAVVVPVDTEGGGLGSEFFMVQNRYQIGNDDRMPGEGLLIWHVDARLDYTGQEFFYNNQDTSHKLLRLMEADGKEQIESRSWIDWLLGRNRANKYDYYTSGKTLGPNTTPNTTRYDGDQSFLRMRYIKKERAHITVRVNLQVPVGQTRIGLSWGAEPADLDSHLTGPDGYGDRFHVYFWNLSSESASLDHDDTTSYGPETTTVFSQQAGVYRFSVHDYTDRWETYSTALATSGATVTVYRNEGIVATFRVPQSPGTLWTVFEMDGQTITPVNRMGYTVYPDDVQSSPRVPPGLDTWMLDRLPQK